MSAESAWNLRGKALRYREHYRGRRGRPKSSDIPVITFYSYANGIPAVGPTVTHLMLKRYLLRSQLQAVFLEPSYGRIRYLLSGEH